MSLRIACISLAMILSLSLSLRTQAATWTGDPPVLHHNPSTGNLWLTNTATVLGTAAGTWVFVESSGQNLLPLLVNPIPGSILVGGEVPAGFSFLLTPWGTFDLGPIVVPGTPSSDLSVNLAVSSFPMEFVAGTVVTVPEPASLATGCLSILSLAAFRRRQQARRAAPQRETTE